MKTLTLSLKKKWFDMIMSGEKKEEYRDIKPHYIARLFNRREMLDCIGLCSAAARAAPNGARSLERCTS